MNFIRNFARTLAVAAVLAIGAPILSHMPVFGSANAFAEVISRIVVKGNNRIAADTIANYITIKPGKSFGPGEVDSSIKQLYGTGLFSDVGVVPSGGTLVITVVENPIVNRVLFEGNKKVKNNIIVTLVDTKPRGVLNQTTVQGDVARIVGYYSSIGRGGATVEPRITDVGDNRVDVTFVVSDGERVGISKINFIGNQAFSASRLKGLITTRQTNFMSWLSKRDVYDQQKLANDQETLRRFYTNHGYADFRVLSADAVLNDAGDDYIVTFTVEEGERYRYGSVNIDSSIPGIDTNEMMGYVRTRPGSVFDGSQVERTIEDLTFQLARRGFAFAQVQPRGDRDYANHTINVTYMIDEGPRVYVERIDIRGNTKTRDYVIRREFAVSEGDPYNKVLIDKTERRLRNTQYFQSVAITTEPGSTPDRVVVVVTVADQSTGSFSVSGGYSTDNGFIAEVTMEEKNFLGRGQILKISVGRGTTTNTYNLSFTDPYFLGRRMSAGFDVYRKEQLSTANSPYNSTTNGGGLRFGVPISEELNIQGNYKISQTEVDYGDGCDGNNCIYFPSGTTLTSSVGYTVTYSTIDNYQDPRKGVFLKLSQDFAGVGGDTHFIRSTVDARYYQPLTSKADIVGFVRVQGGNITGLGENVRIIDNFFKGGETIRGFAPLGIGARDNTLGTSLGGKTFVVGTAEVQFPIPFFPADFGLRAAVFGDVGTLFGVDNPGVNPSDIDDGAVLRASAGGSVLWASPFGLLRADFALPLAKADWDETQWFRLGIGSQF